ncbi:DUF3159 domain-containing protein [Pseudarthrobacter cellobiosi]|uniref:DUF3159 domain-containing protein n=1 Tax=Pseudarthrobacter cellobiosi TaxID=2953654 RepID=UPI00208E0A36|nr:MULTISPECIES: DUF3159 domain-containing protein [unclassified Pseudarthrobacter]MCO4256553.1 DUF3159 domain-containing protein [Pseudarthrobacter sp. HLT1-5]MCO4276176.1 DUF3159 domain-containing protein [Pseudarthrobacter sp. HLT3-5]
MTSPQQPEPSKQPEPSAVKGLAEGYAAKAGLHRTHDGRIDVLKSAGGIQGIAESIVPGLVFLIAFTITRDLTPSLVAALASAAVFTVVRLVQRRPLTQALAGVVGVGISAWLANTTGKAEDFYLPGFFTNTAYILAMVVSIAIKWPVAGLLFGIIRNEGLDWRKDPARLKAYRLGTWIIVAVLVLRLVVQVPLYLMGEDGLAALATTRLIMGAPLYILGVWIAWLLTRPVPADADTPTSDQPPKPSSSGA